MFRKPIEIRTTYILTGRDANLSVASHIDLHRLKRANQDGEKASFPQSPHMEDLCSLFLV